MKRKLRIGVIFGGKSAEHEVSLQSAKNVLAALDKEKYDPILIGITKEGRWLLQNAPDLLLSADMQHLPKLERSGTDVALAPQHGSALVHLDNSGNTTPIDVFFPIVHGPFGEDGTLQGLLKLADVPFVGAGVLGSAVGMDKDVMKRLLRDAGIPIAQFVVLRAGETVPFEEVAKRLGTPFFVKPANLGSSVGVSKVTQRAEYETALHEAFRFDRKVLLERGIVGREIECAVLGNDHPVASVPGEVIVNADFYSYDAKYVDEHGATLEIPAKLDASLTKRIQDLAVKTFLTLGCEGMGRVDFFLQPDGTLLVNEINTIPGFTAISMYPKLWEASGISYTELVDKLIQLALERFQKEQQLQTHYSE